MYNNKAISRDSKVCRLCMNECQLSSIFLSCEDQSQDLSQKIIFCSLAHVNENDDLPKYICKLCKTKLSEFYEFKLKCVAVEEKLKELTAKENYEDIEEQSVANFTINEKRCFIEESDFTHNSPLINNFTEDISYETIQDKKFSSFDTNVNIQYEEVITHNIKSDAPHQCDKCGKTFQSKGVLNKHLTSHDNIKEFACQICYRRYARKDYLTSHMKKHKGIQKYICEICPMKFYNKQDLVRHTRVHSEERQYSCQRCDKKFKRSFDIISHMRVHTGHRPYVCKQCPKSYKSHSGLSKHYKHHNVAKTVL